MFTKFVNINYINSNKDIISLKKNIKILNSNSNTNNKFSESYYKIKEYISKINSLKDNTIFRKTFSSSNIFYNQIFNSGSSSIIKYSLCDEQYIVNTRLINYKLNTMGKSDLNNKKCISINKIDLLDKNFNIIKSKYLFPDNLNKKYAGVEDIRLFNSNNTLYYIGSYYNQLNNKVQIVSNKFNADEDLNLKIIIPTFKTDFNWEKNWVFFNNDEDLYIIYKWNPLFICKIDYNNNSLNLIKSIENLPDIFNNFRGSTNGILFNDKIWFIVHQQKSIINDFKCYDHNFVVFDKDMNLLGYSNNFKFENYLVEFCIGMDITYDNKFVITYSTLDSTSNLVVFSPEYINSLINYI
jgi:hypothetical protein